MRIVVWIFLIGLIIFRFFSTLPKYKDGQKVRITQKVTSEPVRYSFYQSFNLSGLTVYIPKFPEVTYGDSVVVEGTVEGRKLSNAKLIEVSEGRGPLVRVRKRLIDFYQSALPQPYSGLIAGVVLGSKAGLSEDFWDDLKVTGTAHVVVASGMNVTLVTGFLVGMVTIFLPRRKAIPLAIAGIWVYSLISGFDAPIVRAAVMGSVAFLAQWAGRVVTAWKALFLSAACMLIAWPQWLTDLGFILSFVATTCLLLFEARVRKVFSFLPNIIREGFSTSLAAQIGVAPIIFVTFGQFNLLSPLINALILWTIAPITILAGLSGILGLVIPLAGKLILYLSYPLTFWFVKVVTLFS